MRALKVLSLAAVTTGCISVLGIGWAVSGSLTLIGLIAMQLLANDVDRNAGRIGAVLVAAAARLLPPSRRQEELDRWSDDVLCAAKDGRGLRPLLKALGIAFLAAPCIGLRMRRSDRQSRRDAGATDVRLDQSLACLTSLTRKSAMIGVFGPWGSGKSAALRRIRDQVATIPGAAIVDFNPWQTAEADIANAVVARAEKCVRERRLLPAIHIRRFRDSAAVPPGRALRRLTQAARVDRVIVTVDDIDRCSPDRAAATLAAIAELRASTAQVNGSGRRGRRSAAVTFVIAADGPYRFVDSGSRNRHFDQRLLALRFDAIYASPEFSTDVPEGSAQQ